MSAISPPNPISADLAGSHNADAPKSSAVQGKAVEDRDRRHRAEAFNELLADELQVLNGVAPASGAETAGDGRQAVAADGRPLPADLTTQTAGEGAFNPLAALPGHNDRTPDPKVAADGPPKAFAGVPNPVLKAPTGDVKGGSGEWSDPMVRGSGSDAYQTRGATTGAMRMDADGDC